MDSSKNGRWIIPFKKLQQVKGLISHAHCHIALTMFAGTTGVYIIFSILE